MGFEAFRVEIRGGNATNAEADSAVRALPHVRSDHDSLAMKGSTYYVMEDGRHAIELELMDNPMRLSCRFVLCNPPSVDSTFLELLRVLMLRPGMEAKICDDVSPADSRGFSLAEFPEFQAVTRKYIAKRRAEWITAFGDRQMAATTNEAYERIILPHCLPAVEQPK